MPEYVTQLTILIKDQKTLPTCLVALLNPSALQGTKAFSFFFCFLSLVLQTDRAVLKKTSESGL